MCNRFQGMRPPGVMAGASYSPWSFQTKVHEGAEAIVSKGEWLGKSAMMKLRKPKGYRHPDLDTRLTKSRMAVEVRALSLLQKRNFPSPQLLHVDQQESMIIISEMKGSPLFDAMVNRNMKQGTLHRVGETIRRMHENGVSHGDLTTHNIMVDNDGVVSLIDFGLAKISPELESLGQDLQVLNECLTASHSDYPEAMEEVVGGYSSSNRSVPDVAESSEVTRRFDEIRNRVRYLG
ncbi:MAG: Kae1-associated kinase Bud32 [Euryarchaeota archaeon]|nr:Kae1-associated kinase Bud32 [Euryarchaeota archaeon]